MTEEEIFRMALLLVVGSYQEGVPTRTVCQRFGIDNQQNVRYFDVQRTLREMMKEGILICRASKPKSKGGNGEVIWLPGRLFPPAYRKVR